MNDRGVVCYRRRGTREDATENSKEVESDNEEGKWKHFGLGEMTYMIKY